MESGKTHTFSTISGCLGRIQILLGMWRDIRRESLHAAMNTNQLSFDFRQGNRIWSRKADLGTLPSKEFPARHPDLQNKYVRNGKKTLAYTWECQAKCKWWGYLDATSSQAYERACSIVRESLYGLLQAGRLWRKLFYSKLVGLGFVQCTTDMFLYIRDTDGKVTLYVCMATTCWSPKLQLMFWTLLRRHGVLVNKRFGCCEYFLVHV